MIDDSTIRLGARRRCKSVSVDRLDATMVRSAVLRETVKVRESSYSR